MVRAENYANMEVKRTDKTRMNKIRGEKDLRSFGDALTFLIDFYEEHN